MPTLVGAFRKRPVRKAIGYIRVSTSKQGRSGLGLEAQQEALRRFAEIEGFEFAETFTEVESGKNGDDHRPELAKALERARKVKARGQTRDREQHAQAKKDDSKPARSPMCLISRLTASAVKGPPRSVAKTKLLSGDCRRSSRSALISSPRSG
jgi:hypothetical protein